MGVSSSFADTELVLAVGRMMVLKKSILSMEGLLPHWL